MVDENTPLAGSQPHLNYDGEAEQDAETDRMVPHIDRGFLVVALLGIYLAAADDSFVLSTHGEIASNFDQVRFGSWLISAYTLGYMVALPLYGRLSDLYGPRSILLIAYLTFSIGCSITGLAPSIWFAILGRLVAGVGAAGMTDLVSIIVNDMAPPREVAVIRSYFGIILPLGISTGGPVGGILTDLVGWRLSFIIQIPLGLICFFTTLWRLPVSPREHSKQTPDDCTDPVKTELNVLGIAFLGVLLSSVMILCHSLGDDGQEKQITLIVSLSVIALSGIAYGLNEKFWTNSPLMPLESFQQNHVWAIYLAQFFVYFSIFGVVSNMSEYFTRTKNASNKSSGAFFIMLTVGSVFGSSISGYLIKRTGKYKALSLGGWFLMLLGVVLIMVRWPQAPHIWEVAYLAVEGFGFMVFNATFFVAILTSVPKDSGASAITTYYLAQQLGILVGVTSTTAITRRVFKDHLLRKLAMEPMASEIIRNVLRDNRFAFNHLPQKLQGIIANTFMQVSYVTPTLSLMSLMLAIPSLCFLPQRSLDH